MSYCPSFMMTLALPVTNRIDTSCYSCCIMLHYAALSCNACNACIPSILRDEVGFAGDKSRVANGEEDAHLHARTHTCMLMYKIRRGRTLRLGRGVRPRPMLRWGRGYRRGLRPRSALAARWTVSVGGGWCRCRLRDRMQAYHCTARHVGEDTKRG